MENQQPEALILVNDRPSAIGDDLYQWALDAEDMIRRLHARVQELEAMLDAVGAGGVSAQRVTQGKGHVAQDSKMEAAQEPFGYFKAEPFGWRDCAETDEGAIALYEAPQPQADATAPQGLRECCEHLNAAAHRITQNHTGEAGMKNAGKERAILYREFCEWCYTVQHLGLDPRLHTHSGRIEDGGYISNGVTAKAFAAWQAARLATAAPQQQADARDAELVAAVVYASTEAMKSSMESPSFDGSIILESQHAASLSLALGELEQHRAAIAAAKEMK